MYMATVFCQWVIIYEEWGFGQLHRGRVQNAIITYYPELTTLFLTLKVCLNLPVLMVPLVVLVKLGLFGEYFALDKFG